MVFYARETESGRLVALRVRKAQAGDQTAAEYVVAQAPLVGRGVMPVPSAPAPVPVSPPTPVVHAPPVAAYDPPPAAPWSEPHAVQAPAPPAAPPTVAPSVTSRRSARGPLIGGAVVIVLASIGYLASRPGGDPAGTAAMPPAVAPVADSLPAVAPAPAADTASVAASTPSTPTPASGTPSGPRSSVADSGTLQLFALPPNARVTVDGRSYKARTIALKTGAHTLEIAADGFEPLSQSVTIAAGRGLRVAPTLVAIAKRAPGGDAPENKPAPKPTCRSATRESRWSAALELCTADANGGDVAAMVNLARQYSKGLGVPANGEQAYSWYAKAAEKGDAEAQTFIAYALRDGQHVKRDEKESVRWFKTAAEAGNSAAEFEYGVALDRGKGVKKDQAAAREWYRKAAAAGLAEAAFRLGRLHEDGDGGPRSDEQAAVAYERAAALGHAEGALKIARWYRDGRGVGKSPEKALQWFKKAAELGNEDAAKEAAKLEKGKH
jgi:TPR repeat protein